MKTIFYLILLVISISGMAISQTNTFYKSYPLANFYNTYNKKSINVLPTADGGYIIQNTNEFKLIKTDQFGFTEYTKEYPHFTSASLKLIKTLDGGFAAVGNSDLDTNSVFLIKFDNNLDTLWTRGYPKNMGKESAQDLIQLSDSSFIFSSHDINNNMYWLRKIDVEGVLLLLLQFNVSSSFSYYSYLVNLNDSDFLFYRSRTLTKYNSNCDSLWGVKPILSQSSYLTSDGYILVLNGSRLKKFNQNGNLIYEKTISNINSITEDASGNYVYITTGSSVRASKVGIIDTAGNQVLEKELNDNALSVISCSDGGFIISGEFFFDYSIGVRPIWLLKTDNHFEYTAIQLRTPLDSQRINIFNTYNITWNSNNVNYVNIDYSTDCQMTWNTIIHYYPAEEDTFSWTIPDIPAGDLFIRISDSFNPNVYDRSDPPQNAVYYQVNDYIAANEIKMWMANNGSNSHDPRTDWPGFFWPGGEDATISAIFQDGLVWGGKVNGEIRVNGSTYRYGLTPGCILPSGLPSDPLHIKSKIFKLKKDWQYLPPSAERDRYEFDFLNWPVDVGAPWDDNNGDGVYTPGIDEPKIIGDETLFFVANDLDTARSLYTYGSTPIGLEFQVTTFGYNTELLKDVVFKKFKVINKSSTDVTDMYFTYWADDDLGFASDDLSCFDSTHNMAYVYNFDNEDEFYYGTPPPAVAHMIVQGPIIPAASSDSARFDDGWRKGFKNLGMTSSGLIVKNSSIYPDDAQIGFYEGTLQFYNQMQGLRNDGSYIIDPTTNLPTIWPLTGDPVTATGWYLVFPGMNGGFDQRCHLPTGPFNLAISDTQEVVIAFLIKKGTDNLNSITELRNYASQIQHWYDNDFVTDVNESVPAIPTEFSLSQNYPNPFNPTTTIKYAISNRQLVTLKVYDILGSEIATLVNEEQNPGSYKVEFNSASGIQIFASGIYFYQLKAGSFVETKKMILLK